MSEEIICSGVCGPDYSEVFHDTMHVLRLLADQQLLTARAQ